MRLLRGWLIALLLVAAATAAILFYSLRTDPLPVRVARVRRGRVEETVTGTKAGSLRSRRTADISVDVAGTIVALHAREGRRVAAGEPLLSTDSREAAASLLASQKELVASEAFLEEARARHKDASRERARLEQLRQTESVREADVDAADTQLSVAKAGLDAALARVEARRAEAARAKVVLEKCDVVAPFDGVIAERLAEAGEWASPGRIVLRLVDPTRLYVRAELDEVDIAELRVGLDVRVELDPLKARRFAGKVTRVSPVVSEIEEQNRTVEIEAEFSGGHENLELKPGTSADVEVILRAEENRLRVPAQALLEGDRVLVAGADGRARAVALRTGLRNWEWVEVVEGLADGDRVIVSLESEELKDGAAIRVEGEETPR
ncbi:MAG: efflux RND transporter periplasmic adaptor subunit [Planctomycetes bacterium]|nr:efflux RND transporter periplasmic adaptor subunit [Planctomycetota bacterium]